MNDRKITLKEIVAHLDTAHEVLGNSHEVTVSNVATVWEAGPKSLTFVADERPDKAELVKATNAGIVICDRTIVLPDNILKERCFIRIDEPRLMFARVVNVLFKEPPEWGVHKSAIVHADAKVHAKAYVGPNAVLGRCIIGEETVVHGNCFIFDNVTVGKRVIIGPGCVIGGEGFGYWRHRGEILSFPHLGGVLIEDDVHVGANTCIDRGGLGMTTLKKGCKIDNLVHVAHNVTVGEDTLVMADAMLGGSTTIGRDAWIAPAAVLRDQLKIGEKATVGLGSVATKSIPPNEVWMGVPAKKKEG